MGGGSLRAGVVGRRGLYALSDQGRTLYRLGPDFTPTAEWTLDVDKPEGLVVAHGYVDVVNDATSELITYTPDDGR